MLRRASTALGRAGPAAVTKHAAGRVAEPKRVRLAPLSLLSAQYERRYGRKPEAPRWTRRLAVAGALVGAAELGRRSGCEAPAPEEKKKKVEPGSPDPELPTYSFEEVQRHTGAKKNGTWVVYRHGVYDITKFIASHPGGTKILLAAGSSIEPFWQLYAAHNHADVHEILERLRIGNLRDEDVVMLEQLRKERYGDGPYSRDPQRHPALKVNSSMPFNAEPPAELLMESFITPNDLFFVRNHLPVPDVNIEAYSLKISGIGIGKGTLLVLEEKIGAFEISRGCNFPNR